MVRASSVASICTNRLEFSYTEHDDLVDDLKARVEKKGLLFDLTDLHRYLDTTGLKTSAKAVMSSIDKKVAFERDDLPPGAKTYLQKAWLENHGFISFSVSENDFALAKGIACEDNAITLLNSHYGAEWRKNTVRINKGFLTGEADIVGFVTIRDVKCPESWETFREKTGIPTVYFWQLIAYCYLYDRKAAFLDYVLMPVPDSLSNRFTSKLSQDETLKFIELQNKIHSMPSEERIKTFTLSEEVVESNLPFMLKRLEKAEEYYSNLDYDTCMKMNN